MSGWPWPQARSYRLRRRRRSVPVGDEAGEPPRAVVGERAGRALGVEVGVRRQLRHVGRPLPARPRRLRPADEVGHPLGQPAGSIRCGLRRGRRSEKARGATRFAVPSRSSPRLPARTRCAGRRSRRRCRTRRPPARGTARRMRWRRRRCHGASRRPRMRSRRGDGVVHGGRDAVEQRLCRRTAEADEFDRAAVGDWSPCSKPPPTRWAWRQEQGRAPGGRTCRRASPPRSARRSAAGPAVVV